jgi:hypothetical protein
MPPVIEIFSKQHVTLMFTQRKGPWKPCAEYSKNPLSPNYNCIATRMNMQGLPLQEMAYASEIAAGKPASDTTPRLCILCSVYAVSCTLAASAKFNTPDGSPLAIHSWGVEVDDSDPENYFTTSEVILPETTDHSTTGIASPFLKYSTALALYRTANEGLAQPQEEQDVCTTTAAAALLT